MAIDEDFVRALRDRASIVRYASRKLAFDQRKSQPARGDYWACCPFHGEKTPSFHVIESRGLFKCFGCGEQGDIFGLVMKLEGLSFPEAVERIAADNGMALPEERGRDREATDRRRRLYGVLSAAQAAFTAALHGPDGAAARAYLERRGLGDPALWRQFELGWAPAGWTWLSDRLGRNATEAELEEAGLVKTTQDGRRKVDVFRARLMFPIHDAQGRTIAFGGRLIEPGDVKYLNSPETPLFSKGRCLYRLHAARAVAARAKARGLVVAEGYLDVVAFERAGVAAVAPLGTALTDDQLELIWRSGPEPVFCFDGDGAGVRAAHKALDRALPHLSPARTVRIALLPAGEDPDDLFRRGGAPALAAVVDAARPAVDALFERERDAEPLATPEQKAGFKGRLRSAAGRIGHEETRREYLRDLLARADALLRPPRPSFTPPAGKTRGKAAWTPGARRPPAPVQPSAELKNDVLRRRRAGEIEGLVRMAVDRPSLLDRGAELFAALAIADSELDRVRHVTLDLFVRGEKVDRGEVTRHLLTLGDDGAARRVALWPLALEVEGAVGEALDQAAEAQWMALVSLNVMSPAVSAEVAAAGARPECDSAEFARLQAQLGARRDRASAAIRFGEAPDS